MISQDSHNELQLLLHPDLTALKIYLVILKFLLSQEQWISQTGIYSWNF
jgi:hypothetical protein